MTILHVEDDPDLPVIVEHTFRNLGFTGDILNATSVNEAMQILEKRQENSQAVDLVILDFNLPDGTGCEILRRIKTNPVWCGVPVLMLSGQLGNDTVIEAYALGANCYLPKTSRSFLEVLECIYQHWISAVRLPPHPVRDETREVLGRAIGYKTRLSQFYGALSMAFIHEFENSSFWLGRALIEGNHANLIRFLMQLEDQSPLPAEEIIRSLRYAKAKEAALNEVEHALIKIPSPSMEVALHLALAIEAPFDPSIMVGLSARFPNRSAATQILKKSTANQLRELARVALSKSTDVTLREAAEELRLRANRLEQSELQHPQPVEKSGSA